MDAIKTLDCAMRAKVGIVWVRTAEEQRVLKSIGGLAAAGKYECLAWTVTKGLVPFGRDEIAGETRELSAGLDGLVNKSGRNLGIFLDAGAWLADPVAVRKAKDVHQMICNVKKDEAKQIIVVDAGSPPAGLAGVTVIEWDIPDRVTMGKVLDGFMEWMPDSAIQDVKVNGNREAIIESMMGLLVNEASNALSRSLSACGKLDPKLIAKEKAQVVKGSGLEWYDADPRGLEGVGGMDALKEWLLRRRAAFGQKAREYGLPSPKGVCILGIPGSGKSLTAKCMATAWGVPLLKMDVGALFSKWVGESEGKIRQALATAEAVAPCVLWVDEIEKAFASSGEGDGGTSARVFGTFLTWMQDRKPGVFVVATANDVLKLPAEFLRAGRWDELWFVDLPTLEERTKISEVVAAKYPACRAVAASDVAATTDEYTGAEIEQAYIDAMYRAFDDNGRPVSTNDVVYAAKTRIPLSKTMSEKIEALRKWAAGRARMASRAAQKSEVSGRAIE